MRVKKILIVFIWVTSCE